MRHHRRVGRSSYEGSTTRIVPDGTDRIVPSGRLDLMEEGAEELSEQSLRVELLNENDSWSVLFPGLPLHGDGATQDEALDDAVVALRDYAGHWADHLYKAPNHAGHWALVDWIDTHSDDDIRALIASSKRADEGARYLSDGAGAPITHAEAAYFADLPKGSLPQADVPPSDGD